MQMKKSKLNECVFVLAHGAGADKDSDWMVSLDELLTAAGLEVVRFNFPYMIKRAEDGKRRPPDRQPKLLEAFNAQLGQLSAGKKIIIGGKSMGGRMASLLACDSDYQINLDGVVCMGFPFHPPGKPEKYRGEHLQTIGVPTLILQGERDTFGNRGEVEGFALGKNVRLLFLPDGDHSFKPRVKSGLTLGDNLQTAATQILNFIHSL